MVVQLYEYPKTHQIVYFKRVNFLVYELYLFFFPYGGACLSTTGVWASPVTCSDEQNAADVTLWHFWAKTWKGLVEPLSPQRLVFLNIRNHMRWERPRWKPAPNTKYVRKAFLDHPVLAVHCWHISKLRWNQVSWFQSAKPQNYEQISYVNLKKKKIQYPNNFPSIVSLF